MKIGQLPVHLWYKFNAYFQTNKEDYDDFVRDVCRGNFGGVSNLD